MKKTPKKTPKIRMPKIRLNANFFIVLATVVLCSVLVVKGIMYQPAISAYDRKAEETKTEMEYEEQKIKEIDENKKNMDTDEYKEKIARENLGMMKMGELMFVDISGQE